ncbi:MAG: hypothetical protein WC867_03090 [Candidatus Pacearchaeota archaeon]|jgi:hypothetical protein
MIEINPSALIKQGFEIEIEKIKGDLSTIEEEFGFSGLIRMIVNNEEARDFDSSTPTELIYREIGKLDARRITPFAKINSDYLRSLLISYEQLLSLIQDPNARTYVKSTINAVRENIQNLRYFSESMQ